MEGRTLHKTRVRVPVHGCGCGVVSVLRLSTCTVTCPAKPVQYVFFGVSCLFFFFSPCVHSVVLYVAARSVLALRVHSSAGGTRHLLINRVSIPYMGLIFPHSYAPAAPAVKERHGPQEDPH